MKKHYDTQQRRDFYQAMYTIQGGKCAICDKPDRLVVDHNHQTGESRGLLCYTHNTGLGMFQDNPEQLEKAAKYLRTKGFSSGSSIIQVTSPTSKVDHSAILQLLKDNPTISRRSVSKIYAATVGCSFSVANMRVARVAKKYGVTGPITREISVTPQPLSNEQVTNEIDKSSD